MPLNQAQRTRLNRQAAKRGITPEEMVRRIAAAATKDDLYEAVVDEG